MAHSTENFKNEKPEAFHTERFASVENCLEPLLPAIKRNQSGWIGHRPERYVRTCPARQSSASLAIRWEAEYQTRASQSIADMRGFYVSIIPEPNQTPLYLQI